MINNKPSDVRYLDPRTLAVIHTETVEEFRAKHGTPDFKKDPEEFDVTNEKLVTSPPNQEHRVILTETIDSINKLEGSAKGIVYDTLVEQQNMETVAKKYDVSYDVVRQTVSRFRKTLNETRIL